jgi:hypothetical protein
VIHRVWLLFLPVLFLPDLGAGATTDVGIAELSDYLIVPFLGLVYYAGRRDGRGAWRGLIPLLLAFVVWALLSTITIDLRYGYTQVYYIPFGLVKIGKLGAYALAGFYTARALEQDRTARLAYPWVLLAIGIFLSVSLIYLRSLGRTPFHEARQGFQSSNAISVSLAMLMSWMMAYWAGDQRSPLWRTAVAIASPLLLVGSFLSDGRGGWVAALIGGVYGAWRLGVRPSLIGAAVVGIFVTFLTYEREVGFREQVDMTLDPTQLSEVEASDFAKVAGVDDGQRLRIWLHEAPKILVAPLLGSGMFHRGQRSTLWETGSHNHWIQMYLETGLVGGTLILMVMWRMWKISNSPMAMSANVNIAARAGLLAAFVGGMTGEYFYGGKALLVLLLVVAPALSLPDDVPVAEPMPELAPRLRRVLL